MSAEDIPEEQTWSFLQAQLHDPTVYRMWRMGHTAGEIVGRLAWEKDRINRDYVALVSRASQPTLTISKEQAKELFPTFWQRVRRWAVRLLKEKRK